MWGKYGSLGKDGVQINLLGVIEAFFRILGTMAAFFNGMRLTFAEKGHEE